MAQITAVTSFLIGSRDDSNVRKEEVLKLRGRTLIFGNTIYPISNISAVEVVDLSTERRLPTSIVVFGAVGLLLLTLGRRMTIAGLALMGIAIYSYNDWNSAKTSAGYGLSIVTNARALGSVVLVSNDAAFLRQVALAIGKAFNHPSDELSLNFHFDLKQIETAPVLTSNHVVDRITRDVVLNV